MNHLPIEQPGTILRHYKGALYEVVGLGTYTEPLTDVPTNETLAYRNLKDRKLYFRPIHMFYEEIDVDGALVPRFTVVEKDGNPA